MPDNTNSPAPAASDADQAALEILNQQFIHAVRTTDAAWFDRHLDLDFMDSNTQGERRNRATFLIQVAQPFELIDFDVEDVHIRLMGEFAIIQGRTRFKTRSQAAGRGRYTDVWVRRGSHWRCVAAHATRA